MAPPSMGFSRQEYWSGLPFSPPGDLPNPGVELMSPVSLTLASGFFLTVPPGKLLMALFKLNYFHKGPILKDSHTGVLASTYELRRGTQFSVLKVPKTLGKGVCF